MCEHTKHDILIVEGCIIQLENETHTSKNLSGLVIYSKKLLWNESNCLMIIMIKGLINQSVLNVCVTQFFGTMIFTLHCQVQSIEYLISVIRICKLVSRSCKYDVFIIHCLIGCACELARDHKFPYAQFYAVDMNFHCHVLIKRSFIVTSFGTNGDNCVSLLFDMASILSTCSRYQQ